MDLSSHTSPALTFSMALVKFSGDWVLKTTPTTPYTTAYWMIKGFSVLMTRIKRDLSVALEMLDITSVLACYSLSVNSKVISGRRFDTRSNPSDRFPASPTASSPGCFYINRRVPALMRAWLSRIKMRIGVSSILNPKL
jgi:hypothetical protein